MLAQTVRSNLKDINNLKMRSKTTKFSSLFQTAPTAGVSIPQIKQVLNKDGLVEFDEFDELDLGFEEIIEPEIVSMEDEEIEIVEENSDAEVAEYIVENPNEVVVTFPIISDLQLEERLPFFKSLSLKLANL